MNKVTAHQVFQERVANNLATSVAYENVNADYLSAGTDPFIEMKVYWGDESQASLGTTGNNRTFRTQGVVAFFVHVRKGTGARQQIAIIGSIEDLFLGQQFSGITCTRTQVLQEREKEGWYVVPIHVSFYFDQQR